MQVRNRGDPVIEAASNTSAAGDDVVNDSQAHVDTPTLDAMMQEPAEAVAMFKAMLHDTSYFSVLGGVGLKNIPLEQLMKRTGKEVGDSLKCQGSTISKSGIKLGKKNKKKSYFSARFSLLAALSDLEEMNKELIDHD